uniref:Uncharacterized protein n=1 Tax=Anas platyrhynchos TaxID=8839 RepID=A0A8B9SP06_ANAPL
MLWSPKFSLSNMRVRLTAKGLLRNIRLPSGYKKSTVIFHTVEGTRQQGPTSSQCIQTQTSTDAHSPGTKTAELTQYKTKCENQSGIILQLKKFLSSSNQKFEALTIVIQHLQSEVKKKTKQNRSLATNPF